MRLRLSPRDETFFTMFAESAGHLVVGADLLWALVNAVPEDRQRLADKLRAAEHAADDTTHSILRKLNSTFVTPLDREDIYALAGALDDVMDAMEAAADLMVLYRVGSTLPPQMPQMVAYLQEAARLTADAMPRLRRMDDGLREYWIEVNRIENSCDQLHRSMLAALFGDGDATDAVTVMKLKDVLTELEDAADKFENVANIIESITVKES